MLQKYYISIMHVQENTFGHTVLKKTGMHGFNKKALIIKWLTIFKRLPTPALHYE